MTVEEWQRIFHRELLLLFKEECGRRGVSLKDLSRQAGYAEDYFYLVRSGRRRLTLDLLLKICEHLGRSPADLFRRFAAADAIDSARLPEPSPVDVLIGLREEGEQPSDPFLKRAIGVIAASRDKTVARQADALSLRSLVVQLEESRLSAPDFAKVKLELLGRRLLAEMRRRPTLEPTTLGDLAATLAAWAALRRLVGSRHDANDALCAAFALADQAQDAWVRAFCHQKAAYLLQDLGRADLGLAFMEKATLLFNEGGSPLDLARSLVDRGYMLSKADRREEANRVFEAALRQLPPSEKAYVCSVHYNLAVNAREAGDLTRAVECLERAALESDRGPRYAFIRREQGMIEIQLRRFEAASQHLRAALRLFGKCGLTNQVAAVALDCAEVLVRTRRLGEAEALAREVASWLPAKATNRLLRALLEDFLAIIRLGQLNLAEVEKARGRLDGCGDLAGYDDQPPGGM